MSKVPVTVDWLNRVIHEASCAVMVREGISHPHGLQTWDEMPEEQRRLATMVSERVLAALNERSGS